MVFTARDWIHRITWLQLIWVLGVGGMQVLGFISFWVAGPDIDTQLVITGVLFAFATIATIGLVASVLRIGRRRYRAIMHDANQMPLARSVAPVTPVPSLTGAPLELLWMPRRMRAGSGCVAAILTLTGLGALAVAGALFVGPWLFPSPIGTPSSFYFAGGLLFLAVALFLFAVTRPVWRQALAPAQRIGIVADEAGLHEHRLDRRERVVRWEDAHLLEVATPLAGNAGALTFTVFARHGRVSWTMPPLGPTPEELSALQATHNTLLALLSERAGLQPRTLERSLLARPTKPAKAEEPTTPERPRTLRARIFKAITFTIGVTFVLAFSLFCAAILVGLAYVCVTFHLTGVPALDDYAALATLSPLLFLARILISFILWPLDRDIPLPYQPPAPVAPSYELRWRMRPGWRIFLGTFGVALLPAGALGVWGFVQWAGGVLTGASDVGLSTVFPFASFGPIFAGALGITLLWRSVTGAPRVIRADAQGLIFSQAARQKPTSLTTLPWEDITSIKLTKALLGQTTVTVRGRELGRIVTWPANAPVVPAPPSTDGTQPLTPTELAALVAARSLATK